MVADVALSVGDNVRSLRRERDQTEGRKERRLGKPILLPHFIEIHLLFPSLPDFITHLILFEESIFLSWWSLCVFRGLVMPPGLNTSLPVKQGMPPHSQLFLHF